MIPKVVLDWGLNVVCTCCKYPTVNTCCLICISSCHVNSQNEETKEEKVQSPESVSSRSFSSLDEGRASPDSREERSEQAGDRDRNSDSEGNNQ